MITSMKVIYYPQIGFQIALACIEGVDAQQQLHIPGTDLEYQVWFECSFFFFVLRMRLMIFYMKFSFTRRNLSTLRINAARSLMSKSGNPILQINSRLTYVMWECAQSVIIICAYAMWKERHWSNQRLFFLILLSYVILFLTLFLSPSRDLHSIIVDMEALVVLELEKYILEHTPILLDVTNSLAEIDWYSNAPLLYYYYYFMSAIIFFVLKSTTYFLFFSQSYVIRVCCKRA